MTVLSPDRGSRPPARELSPADIADALGLPRPTAEQATVIGSPPDEPVAIIAGAGSGKTETMAARVVWLVANRHARPEQVLGLTFTRKAARELGGRIRRRLGQLRARGVVDPGIVDGEAEVGTYDAYAQRLVAEHGVRLGREPNPRLLTPTLAWQFAERVVSGYDGPMDDVDKAPVTILDAVLLLHDQMSGHLVEPAQILAHHDTLSTLLQGLPPAPRSSTGVYTEIKGLLTNLEERRRALPMVELFDALKRRRDSVDFADLSALAARIAVQCPDVGEIERDRFPVVLLDEYQDTSHSQLVLLRGLFAAGHPVTAVGDPFQAIYSFRGASAGTLSRFGADFARADGSAAGTEPLSTSFRNSASILRVANALTTSLRTGRLAVAPLRPVEDRSPGEVRVGLFDSVFAEAESIAEQIDEIWSGGTDPAARPDDESAGPPEGVRSVAVLMRKRAGMDLVARALQARGLPVEVVGLGGLLHTPAVADVVATLRVIADPSRGDAMMRLLTGSRWRLGPRDVVALGRHSRSLARRARGEDLASARVEVADAVTIVDAVDASDTVPGLSPTGRERVTRLARMLRSLRARAGMPLPDLVVAVVRALDLDIEVAAATGDITAARADLDAFGQVVAEFADDTDDARVTTLLAYLDTAEETEDGFERGVRELAPDRIQVLTVHGAKGLEWDAVFVAGVHGTVFPSNRATRWTSALGQVPFDLRGDAASLPCLDLTGVTDQVEAKRRLAAFDQACKDHNELEETRLGYVALTRARSLLVCTGARVDPGLKNPRPISTFLQTVRAEVAAVAADGLPARELAWCDDDVVTIEPSDTDVAWQASWPYDGLAERRAVVEDGAARVQAAAKALARGATLPPEVEGASAEWADDVDLLLAELAVRERSRDVVVELPEHLSVSQLVELERDPQALARRLRRPVPHAPNPQARRGTAFHAWVEQHFGRPALLDVTELPGSADDGGAEDTLLPSLQSAFLASEWAERTPLEVESAFELVLDGVLIRGRVDAVFADDATAAGQLPFDDQRIEVVDWKTGTPPPAGRAATAAAVQLAAYRLAFAHLLGLQLGQVRAAFHFVAQNITLRPADLLDRDGLLALIRSVEPAAASPGEFDA